MTFEELICTKIEKPDRDVYEKARAGWDAIAKPLDGMGDFEDLTSRLCAITGNIHYRAGKKAIVIACADNGIVEENVTQCGKNVTLAVSENLGLGRSSLCILSKSTGADIIPVDIGIDCEGTIEGVIDKKLARGSKNFLKEPAMSYEQALDAIEAGIEEAECLKKEGYDLIAGGEMGIGNTTTSTAVLCCLLHLDYRKITGRGAGLSDAGLLRKQEVIKAGLEKYGFADTKTTDDSAECAFKALQCLGGFDIAYLTGLYIGAAMYHLPVVLDGFISVTAAVLAEKLLPNVKEYMIPSHKGRNSAIETVLSYLGLKPIINGNMALGEGTGAAMVLPLIDMALDFYNSGTSFEEEKIESYKRF